jgi:hypothetical protein
MQCIDGIDDYIGGHTRPIPPDRRNCGSEEQLGRADSVNQSMRRLDEYVVTFKDRTTAGVRG